MQSWRRHRRGDDRSAIGHHYDVGNEFYRLWLDERMVYSCAYYRTGQESIDEAQLAKLEHICRKLRLAPEERLLDVGCGWGALVLHAARRYGVRAVGITLSENQAKFARERVAEAGLAGQVEILLMDYRDLRGALRRERIRQGGEHRNVRARRIAQPARLLSAPLPRYCAIAACSSTTASRRRMSKAGPSAVASASSSSNMCFRAANCRTCTLAAREIAAAGFEIADVESLRPHYAQTLAQWYRRLESRNSDATRVVPARTLRTWRIYLAGCSYAFQQGWVNVYQILASANRAPGPTGLPLTRDWMYV